MKKTNASVPENLQGCEYEDFAQWMGEEDGFRQAEPREDEEARVHHEERYLEQCAR